MSELPASWARAELDHVAEVKLGRQRSPKNHVGERMRPYLRAANVTWSGLDLSDVKEMNFTEEESQIFELQPGDVLLAEASGSASEVGKPALWRGEIQNCCFQNTLLRVRSYGPLAEYLLYFLQAEALTGRLGDAARGVGIHHLGAARLSSWPVPMAPLAEQRRIVAAVDEHLSRLDAAELSLHRAKQRLKVLSAAIVARAFDSPWTVRRVADISDGSRNALTIGPFGSNLKVSDYRETGVPLVFVRNIRAQRFSGPGTKFVSRDKASELSAHAVRSGDVLVTKMGDPPGDTAVYPPGPDAIITADCIKISLDPSFDPRFVALAIRSPNARRQIAAITSGVAQKKVSLARFKGVTLPTPPLEEQRLVVAEVEQKLSILDAMDTGIDAALRRSGVLRRLICGRAFAGKLVPQDPSDEPVSVLLERIAAERAASPKPSRRKRIPA